MWKPKTELGRAIAKTLTGAVCCWLGWVFFIMVASDSGEPPWQYTALVTFIFSALYIFLMIGVWGAIVLKQDNKTYIEPRIVKISRILPKLFAAIIAGVFLMSLATNLYFELFK